MVIHTWFQNKLPHISFEVRAVFLCWYFYRGKQDECGVKPLNLRVSAMRLLYTNGNAARLGIWKRMILAFSTQKSPEPLGYA